MSLPDRIDFTTLADGRVIVLKLRRDTTDPTTPRDIPLPDGGHNIKPATFDLDAALDWCAQHGYAIRRWPGGARAWRAPTPWIIRTRNLIQRMREHNPYAQLDFAFDG